MYEASQTRNLNLVGLQSALNGMHLEATTVRFQLCGQQVAVERRFRDVVFESITFTQMQFEQNQFLQIRFVDCSFTDVVFRGCTFVKCNFSGAVFSNTHFLSCTFIDTEIGLGPIEANVKFQNCLVLPGSARFPQGAQCEQNWLMGAGVPERAPAGFFVLAERIPVTKQVPTPVATTPSETILARQREAEQVIPAMPKTASPASVRFSELEKN